ncbi:MAG: cytochrome C [Pseudomonadota bacterium]
MSWRALAAAVFGGGLLVSPGLAERAGEGASALPVGVESIARAKLGYALNCQGCHLSDGAGMGEKVPSMQGEVARWLSMPGGRSYLTRVPGVANAALTDAELAEVMNWTLATFDPDHIPADFEPITADEIAEGRRQRLTTKAFDMRDEVKANASRDQAL